MGRAEKLLARFWGDPKPADFQWSELVRLLSHYGYQEQQGSGSRVKFVHKANRHKIRLHKPHPGPTLKSYQIDGVRQVLNDEGLSP